MANIGIAEVANKMKNFIGGIPFILSQRIIILFGMVTQVSFQNLQSESFLPSFCGRNYIVE
jgi:hypothetical protein